MLLLKSFLLIGPILVRAIALPAETPNNDDDEVSELHYANDVNDPSSGDGLGSLEVLSLEDYALDRRANDDVEDDDGWDDFDGNDAAPLVKRQFLGGRDSSDPDPEAEAEFERARKLLPPPAGGLGLVGCRFNIDVYFKSWHYEPNPSKPTRLRSNGYIRDSDITAALKTLNSNFANYRFKFTLKQHLRYYFDKKSDWDAQIADSNKLGPGSVAYRLADAKRPLSGRPRLWRRNLHVYIVNDMPGSILGFSSLPQDTRIGKSPVTDGVFLDQHNFNGGVALNSVVLTHEIGHWLGLLHTFEGGCKSLDGVNDTLPVAVLSDSQRDHPRLSGCPASGAALDTLVYSCPKVRTPTQRQLLASRQNFMSYYDPPCVNRFSQGQVTRMLDQCGHWRGFNFGFC